MVVDVVIYCEYLDNLYVYVMLINWFFNFDGIWGLKVKM